MPSKRQMKTLVRRKLDDTHIESIDPYTYAEVSMVLRGRRYTGRGFAKRHPRDTPCPRIGRDVAVGRAIKHIVSQLVQERDIRNLTADLHVFLHDYNKAMAEAGARAERLRGAGLPYGMWPKRLDVEVK